MAKIERNAKNTFIKTKKTTISSSRASRKKKKSAQLSNTKPSSALYICRSCVWSEEERDKDGKRQGEFLFQNIKEILLSHSNRENIIVRGVYCLNGCKSPCNVAFRGQKKYGLRYSNLTPGDAKLIVDHFISYSNADKGIVHHSNTPRLFHNKLTVKTPPPIRRK